MGGRGGQPGRARGGANGLARKARLRDTGCMTELTALEERIAHLTRAVDDLSDVVARQEREIAVLTARVGALLDREAEREGMADGAPAANQRPPHW